VRSWFACTGRCRGAPRGRDLDAPAARGARARRAHRLRSGGDGSRMFSLCARAQGAAAAGALEAAAGRSPAGAGEAREYAVALETAQEHLRCLLIDVPETVGLPPDPGPVALAYRSIARAQAALEASDRPPDAFGEAVASSARWLLEACWARRPRGGLAHARPEPDAGLGARGADAAGAAVADRGRGRPHPGGPGGPHAGRRARGAHAGHRLPSRPIRPSRGIRAGAAAGGDGRACARGRGSGDRQARSPRKGTERAPAAARPRDRARPRGGAPGRAAGGAARATLGGGLCRGHGAGRCRGPDGTRPARPPRASRGDRVAGLRDRRADRVELAPDGPLVVRSRLALRRTPVRSPGSRAWWHGHSTPASPSASRWPVHEMALAEACCRSSRTRRGATTPRAWPGVWVEIGAPLARRARGAALLLRRGAARHAAGEARLEIVRTPGEAWCMPCARSVALPALGEPCPRCGSHQLQVTRGDEMRVTEIEIG